HLMTIENSVSDRGGGPYTPLFEAIAEQRGWAVDPVTGSRLNHPDNLVPVIDHQGPHPEYNRLVYNRMQMATDGLTGQEFNAAFDAELAAIRQDTTTHGTLLNALVTGRGS
ncbi:MAG: AHH domain-containing protein, partial [Planctomycetes bacterium]|nr:AHH domain-containing protein [Planctomycetota bacterium]